MTDRELLEKLCVVVNCVRVCLGNLSDRTTGRMTQYENMNKNTDEILQELQIRKTIKVTISPVIK